MFTINEDKSIYATRGDVVFFSVTAEDNGQSYTFQPGDVVRIKVYGKKNAEDVVLQKDFPVTEVREKVDILLTKEEMKIGGIISKHKDYWYEVVLNDDTWPQTIIGYDDDGAKVFRLFPEGADVPAWTPKPEEANEVDAELDMTSTRPIQNQAIARAFARLEDGFERTHAAVAEVNVTPQMFGAIADGESDDTEAIQAAVNAMNETPYTIDVGTKTGTSKILRFPKGVYVISSPIKLGEIHAIDFSNAIIKSDMDDYFFKSSAYKAKYTGGTFIGKNIFTINNNNNDQGNIIIEKAEFKNCEIAIDVTCQSSQFIVEGCKFDSCLHPVVQHACDGMTIEKNWFTCPAPADNDSNFRLLGGKTTFKNNMLIPIPGYGGTETAWIENDQNILMCYDNRFGGENDGRTAVNHKAKFHRDNLRVLLFDNNLFVNLQDGSSCIRLFTLPNTLLVRGNYCGVFTKYILSVTDVETAAFNSDLEEIYALYDSDALEENQFGYSKFRRFQYEIDNNFMQGRTPDDNSFESQRENEMWFLLNNYSKVDRLNKSGCAFSPKLLNKTQKVEYYGTEKARILKLPIFVTSGIELEVEFNPNYTGSNYSVKKSYRVFPTKYWDDAAGKVVEKFAVVDLNASVYPSDINAMVSIGKYNESGEYFGDSANGATGRLAVKITGIAVSCERIACKSMF
jgi:hypothetical protein